MAKSMWIAIIPNIGCPHMFGNAVFHFCFGQMSLYVMGRKKASCYGFRKGLNKETRETTWYAPKIVRAFKAEQMSSSS